MDQRGKRRKTSADGDATDKISNTREGAPFGKLAGW